MIKTEIRMAQDSTSEDSPVALPRKRYATRAWRTSASPWAWALHRRKGGLWGRLQWRPHTESCVGKRLLMIGAIAHKIVWVWMNSIITLGHLTLPVTLEVDEGDCVSKTP